MSSIIEFKILDDPNYHRLPPIVHDPVINILTPIEREINFKQFKLPLIASLTPRTIDKLKPTSFLKKDGITRYDYTSMKTIIDYILGLDIREYPLAFDGFHKIKIRNLKKNAIENLVGDFWRFQYFLFRDQPVFDRTNALYLGTDIKNIQKKLGRNPSKYEMLIQELWHLTFKHLLDNKDNLEVELRDQTL